MKLPTEFTEKMRRLLGEEEYRLFLESYDKPRQYGLRVNTLKVDVDAFRKMSPFPLEPVPWTTDGFYYPEGENPGKHPYYHAGLYYIQEPSAMLPGASMGAEPGDCVLDLCAAPGGKTVQLAAGMKGRGLLVANDINADRVKALVKNVELCGIRNAIVLNESPDKLAVRFEGFFDKILVDAPCSGEGMFRKDEEAARSWQSFKCDRCCGMQREILANVDKMLKPGGAMVYSTCTFSPEEDEQMLAEFLDQHPNYEIQEIPKVGGIEPGRPEWGNGRSELKGTARLWPHRVKGEGHFTALLRKKSPMEILVRELRREPEAAARMLEPFYAFVQQNLNGFDEGGYFSLKGRGLYWLPEAPPVLDGLKVAKFGWFLGELSGERFEPSHSMVTALQKHQVKRVLDLPLQAPEVIRYLKGETVLLEGEKGLTAVCVDGYTLGWAKQTGDMLKNQYPKGWRKMA